MLLQQTVYFMGKIRHLSKIPAWKIFAAQQGYVRFNLESAAILFHINANPVNRVARAGVTASRVF